MAINNNADTHKTQKEALPATIDIAQQVSTTLNPDFDQQWLVVTGASSGIGRGICLAAHQHNARLIMIGRDKKRLDATAQAIGATDFRSVVMDLQNPDSLDAILQPVLKTIGSIYGLCHAAGVASTRALRGLKSKGFNDMMAVNLYSGLELAKIITRKPYLPKQGSNLLFISSIYSQVGASGQTAYCASKGAINSAVRALAVELAPKNSKVNAISPGFVATPLSIAELTKLTSEPLEAMIARHPLGAGTIAQISRSALFLLDPDNHWITGTNLVVDGGLLAQ